MSVAIMSVSRTGGGAENYSMMSWWTSILCTMFVYVAKRCWNMRWWANFLYAMFMSVAKRC